MSDYELLLMLVWLKLAALAVDFFFFGFRVNLSDISSRNVSYNSGSYVMFTLLFLEFKVQY